MYINMSNILTYNNSVLLNNLNPIISNYAQNFISAAGITATTQVNAINTLVNDLMTYDLWRKMYAIYPMVGGTSFTCKWNLKNPIDSDDAFRLTFIGAPTIDVSGVSFNGTTQYCNTFFNPYSNIRGSDETNISLSFYSQTSANTLAVSWDIGAYDNANYASLTMGFSTLNFQISGKYKGLSTNCVLNTKGFWQSSIINSATSYVFRNYSQLSPATISNAVNGKYPNCNIFIGSISTLNSPGSNYSNRKCSYASIGLGLTPTDLINHNNIVQKFQTSLNRSFGFATSTNDITNFINASEITDIVQISAVTYLINNLKSNNLWDKLFAIYPMVGGQVTAAILNLKDPTKYNLNYYLLPAIDVSGVSWNGSTQYAANNINLSSLTTSDNVSMSYYTNTTSQVVNGFEIGSNDSFNSLQLCVGRTSDGKSYASAYKGQWSINSGQTGGSGNNNSAAFWQISIDGASSGTSYFYRNLNTITGKTYTLLNNGQTTQIPFALGCLNTSGVFANFSNRKCQYASIGMGLSPTDLINHYNIVQNFNTILNRQV